MKKLLPVFLLLFFTSATQAQQRVASHSPTSLLVQFENETGVEELENKAFNWIKKTETVYKPYHIYKIEINTEAKDIARALQEMALLPFVKSVQTNRKLERRSSVIPNDSLYPHQWNMHRIQMDSAWGITTGGTTTNGDTVVIAIIDAGFDTSHPDFGNNLWVNRHEIAGDTTDNDGNGYAGDYYGWNTYADNGTILDSIEYAVHGMSVTGIIGAVGNNDSGIAGMGWNNKFMVIIGGGDEANALKSYGYVLTQKKRYIESNGAQGAYVVATNSSWGKSGQFPESAPLWCAFYDSLGKYGIISVTAASNSPRNLDLEGDLPTLCPSDFVVSVTNINSLDNLGGGYGKLHVDLAAPGHSIQTTGSFVESKYKVVYGTSVAAPHVSGIIGLIYSAACDSFSQYAKTHPDSAALWVKYFVMQGVDTVLSLKEKSVSEGRLNAYKTLLLLQDWCNGKLNKTEIPKEYTLFPNPGTNSFTIRGDISQIAKVEIISLTGQVLQTLTLNEIPNPIEITLETPFANGFYIVRTLNDKGEVIFQKKWIKTGG